MFISKTYNNGKWYLSLVKSQMRTNKDGKKVSCRRVIKSLGPLDRFDDGKPNYLERLRQSFRDGHPLIPELEAYVGDNPQITYKFSIAKGSSDCFGKTHLVSNLLIERILEELGVNSCIASAKFATKIKYDVNGFMQLLVAGRLLNPASKMATMRQNDDYYQAILTGEYNEDNVYDTLSFLHQNKHKIMQRINTNLTNKMSRSPSLVYYDVTNFYFEIEEPDEDVLDGHGNIEKKGLRKMGVSKENRRQPIVQMGLFMDDNGIPITVEAFPGNTLDHITLKQALDKDIKELELPHFIMVADRGMHSFVNLNKLRDLGHGYIVSRSLAKSSKAEQSFAFDEGGYTVVNRNFRYKSRIVERSWTDEHDQKHYFKEQVVVYFSRNFQRRAERQNRSFLKFLEQLEEDPHTFRVSASSSKNLKKFFKDKYLNVETGEEIEAKKIRGMIDFEKVKKFRNDLGYYQIVTSELDMNPREVIDKYHGLTQIEDQFRVMKSTLNTRPIYLQTAEHIETHLLICTIALIVLRIIQKRIIKSGKVKTEPDAYWSTGLNSSRIQSALRKWQVELLPNGLYRFMNLDDPDLKLILDAFQIKIAEQLYSEGELKRLKTSIKVF